MSANSFGNFGAYKLDYLKKIKKIDPEAPIDVTNVTHAVSKDVEYFQKNLMPNASGQVVNYTWEKSSEESPSFYKQHEIIFDKEDLSLKMHKNTLDQMATTKGYAHGYTHNEWDTVSNDPPVCQSDKPKRYGIHLSSMTQYAEAINRTLPGHSLY